MKKNRLLENLNTKLELEASVRRYSLADMISESYKTLYQCGEGTNLRSLAESHLSDVKSNPRDISRLSRNLSILKELARMEESNELKDEDLVAEEDYDTVEPNEERVIQTECNECDAPKKEKKEMQESLKEDDDPDLTDEELEELAKHLETIRKERKNAPKTEMTEAEAPKRRGIRCHLADSKKEDLEEAAPKIKVDIYIDGEFDRTKYFDDMKTAQKWADQFNYEGGINDTATDPELVDEAKSYAGLQNFKKVSESKAFYKTFKKMHETLKEGKALTRQESIDLYKAANSALTQMSIELEHNPEFIETFKESTDLLSADVNSLRESLARGKAPSKKTMKSLAKFSEALLCEATGELNKEELKKLSPQELKFYYKDHIDPDEYSTFMHWVESLKLNEADEEDFVGDDEGDVQSEEADAFDQEYAEERVELHKELAAEHAGDEDPEVQEKLAQDAEEVVNLPGTTEEQVAEINGEESSAEGEEEAPEEEPTEDEEDESEITDDELEELKSHLKEMRAAKKSR